MNHLDDEAFDEDAGREFQGLDPREAQAALAEELADVVTDENEEEAVQEETADAEAEAKSAKKKKKKAKKEPEPIIEWSEEDLAAHARMAEALLFAAAEPLDEKSIADRLPAGADIPKLLEMLSADYEGRGVTLSKIDKKWRFVTAPDVGHILEKERITQRRLSRAALETLAIIAYHQPCTRADIEDVRGVAVSKGSLDQLLEIGWVKMRGKRDVPGRPTLYGTSQDFLEHFSLESVQDLPGLADLKAAGLLDARLPPGFSVPSPMGGDDDDEEIEGEETEFAQDFLESEEEEVSEG